MIADLKPHAAYKESGQDWLGSIPAHWSLLRAKRLFREVDERSKTGKEELLAHDQALAKAAQILLKDDTLFYKQFVENESFRRSVGDMVYQLTSQPNTD